MRFVAAALLLLTACRPQPSARGQGPAVLQWNAAVATQPVPNDPDDPAIWVHPADASQSLVVTTNKVAAPDGALVIFDLQGEIVQSISGLDRPNNVDIRGNTAFVTERRKSAVRVFHIDPASRRLEAKGSVPVFTGEAGELAAPMGIALYSRKRDGALFAIVSRKTGPSGGYLWEYRVEAGPSFRLARKFGAFSGTGEIEAVVVDDENGYVYYADEGAGIRKYRADPDQPDANRELALFGRTGYRGDREGLALYATGPGTGYLISTDQIPGGSRYLLYRREGAPGNPHDHGEVVAVIEGGADETDGIDATSVPLGAAWPQGLLVTMNSRSRNFLFFRWGEIR